MDPRREHPGQHRCLPSRRTWRTLLLSALLAAPAVAQPVLDYGATGPSAAPDPVLAGESLTYSITVRNTASLGNDASGVVLRLNLPSGFSFNSSTGDFSGDCSQAASVVTCTLGALVAGGSQTGSVVVDVAASVADGTMAATDFDLYHSTLAAPGVDADVTVQVDTEADVTVTKTGPAEAVPGQNLSYTIVVANAGPSNAANVEIDDDLPAALGTPSISGTGCTCTSFPCNIGTLSAGSNCSVSVSYTPMADDYHLDPLNANPIVNTASVTTDTADHGSSDYDDQASTPVNPKANLSVAIVDVPSNSTVTPGTYTAYRATVTNAGPSRVASLKLTGTSLNVLSPVLQPEDGIFIAANLDENWIGLDLGASDTVDLDITGWANPAAPDPDFVVTVVVAAPPGVTDTDASGNTATDTDTIARVADLAITKNDGLEEVAPNQVVPYAIRVSNFGPSDVTGATVADDFDNARIASISWTCSIGRALTPVATFTDGDAGVDGLFGASGVVVSPDGEHVYVAAKNDNAIAFFRRDTSTGALTWVAVYKDGVSGVDGLAGARAVVVSPDGAHVYAVGENDDAVAMFSRNTTVGPSFGQLTFLDKIDNTDTGGGLDGPVSLAISPDGRHVYVAAINSDAVTALARDAGTGLLTFASSVADGTSPAPSRLNGVVAVGVTFDGQRVLALASTDTALTSFSRNVTTGALTLVEEEVDAVRLAGASGLAIATDGRTAYATGTTGSYVVAYSIDLTNGQLAQIDWEQNGVAGVQGMASPAGVSVAPGLNLVVVHGSGSGQIAVFRRILTAIDYGKLEYIEAIDHAGSSASAFSPGGEQLLALAATANSLGVFTESSGAGGACPGSGSTDPMSEAVNLPAGASVTFLVNATVAAGATGTLVNTATVTAPVGVTDAATAHPAGVCTLDANNNSCTDSDQVGLAADLVVTKTATESSATPGATLHYTVTVVNNGPGILNTANGRATISDASLTGADYSSASWTCTPAGGAICGAPSGSGNINQLVTLPPGSSLVYAITVVVAADASGTACTSPLVGDCVTNTATAVLPAGFVDPTPANSTSTVQTLIARQADLSITKTVVTPNVMPGGMLEFEIAVTNCGPSNVSGATVTDVFPVDFTGATWTCTAANGTCPASGSGNLSESISLDGGNPADCTGGGIATFTVTGTVDGGAEGVLTNVASVTEPAGTSDPTQGNNFASANVVLTASADLAIIKTDNRSTAVPGEPLVYSIAVVNNGPDNVVGATVTDLFSPALRDVAWTCDSEAPALGTLTYVEAQYDAPLSDGLAGASAIVVSPDTDGPGGDPGGEHLYVVGELDSAVAVFSRDGATGKLTFLDSWFDGETQGAQTIDGLAGASAVAMAADGFNVYVAARLDDSVATFTRNPTLGTLVYGGVRKDGGTGGTNLDGASGVAVSPDGKHVYVSADLDDAVTVFSRDVALGGALTYVESHKDGVASVDGLDGAAGVAVSPEGAHVYAVGHDDDAVAVFRRDDDSQSANFGKLTFVEELHDGEVQGLATVDGLDGASAVAVSPDGRHVYVASDTDNAVAVFARNIDDQSADYGRLTFLAVRSATESPAGPGGTPTGLFGAKALSVSPDGEHLYAGGANSDSVVVFQRNPTTGALKYVEARGDGTSGPCVPIPSTCSAQGLNGPSGVALSPDGNHVYLSASAGGTVAVFQRAGAPPAFAFIGGRPATDPPAPVRDGDPVGATEFVDGLDAASAVAVTGDGKHLYATGFADRAIAAFARDSATGELYYIDRWKDGENGVDGLEGASDIAIFGDSIYVVSQSVVQADNALVVFDRDAVTGELTFVEVERDGQNGVSGLFGAAAVAVSPDGRHVYVASRYPGAVAIFDRNTATGAVTFLEAKIIGVAGVSGIQGAHGVAVSSDGKHVYVAASTDDAVVVFARGFDAGSPAAFGRLTEIQVLQDPEATSPVTGALLVQGLDRAIGIATSNEIDSLGSRNVYATGFADRTLVVLRRNVDDASADFGKLTPQQLFVDGQDGIDGLAGARSVRVSGDGKQVYVASEDDDALAVFAREEVNGTLVFVEAKRDGQSGVDGIDQAYDVAVSPNNRQVYVAGFGDDAVAAFSRASGSRCTGSGVGDIVDNVDVAAGGQVVYTVHATVDPAATGMLANVATVSVPGAITEPDTPHEAGVCTDNLPAETGNNVCRDVDLLAPKADLRVEKTDDRIVAVPGEELIYTLTVYNDGASNVVGATVQDDLSAIFPDGASWTCVAAPSGQLTFASSVADGDLQDGGTVTVDGLSGATSVAVSPDGEHVYATGLADDAVAVFALDGTTGALSFLEAEVDGVASVEGLDGAFAVAVSPDGEHVYVTGQFDDTVVVFERESDPMAADFGELTLLQVVQDAASPAPIGGALQVPNLDQPVALAFDLGGEHLYVAAANSSSVVVLARETSGPDIGQLSFVEAQVDGASGVAGIAGASAVAVSPDGDHVYATGENDDAIEVFDRDSVTGALTHRETLVDGAGSIDGLAAPRAIVVSPDGENVYAAGAADNGVAVFKRATTGVSAGTLTFLQVVRDGVAGVQGLAGAASLAVSPELPYGFHLYVGGAAEDAVAVFRRDREQEGRLVYVEVERDGFSGVDGLAGPTDVALTPDGRWLVAAGRLDDALAVFSRPTDSSCSSGSGTMLNDVVNIAAGAEIVYTIVGVVDPDACAPPYPCTSTDLINTASVSVPAGTTDPDPGDNSDTDQDDLSARVDLSIFKTDHNAAVDGLAGARAVIASPDGAYLYAAGALGDGVVVFERDGGNGKLDYVEAELDGVAGVDGINGAAALAIDPDGDHVYVAGSADTAVAVFHRDATSGELDFLERELNGVGGVTGLLGASGVAVSADGDHVYVAGSASSAIAIFARDDDDASATFGQLTFLGEVRDGVDGVDGLGLVRALVLVGDQLYAASEADSSVAVFTRDAVTGDLSFVEAHFEGIDGVTGLAGARALAASPDGVHLYVASSSGAVALFERDAAEGSGTYGQLTFVEALVDGAAGGPDLAGAAGVAVTPDPPGGDPGGQHVYVSGNGDDAVTRFVRDPVTGHLSAPVSAKNGAAGVSGLDGPWGLALSPDAGFVYVAAASSDAVVVFDRDWDSGTETGTGELTYVEHRAEGSGTVAPGDPITYEITVTNNGPSAVQGATVRDIFPAELESVSFTCQVLTPGATCFAGSGDLIQNVNLPAHGSVRFLATGVLKADATGVVSNTATVEAPSGVIELGPSDNSSTDANTVLGRVADLAIEKIACTDPLDCDATATGDLVPGTPVFYQVRVSNNGPSDALGARVTDVIPETLIASSWVCAALPVPGLLPPPPIEVWTDGDVLFTPVNHACSVSFTQVEGLVGPRGVAGSDDGLSIYVASGGEDALAVFRRDLRDGTLEFVRAIRDGDPLYDGACAVTGAVDGLAGATAVVVSPDGNHAYATGEDDDAIVAFSRDSLTGDLTYKQALRDGQAGVNGLGNVRGVAISPDGMHVYTAASSDNGVGIFGRNAGTGLLTYAGIRVDGAVQGALVLDGLAGASDVAVAPDGMHVYAAGTLDSGIAAFSRAAGTGLLTFVQVLKDGNDGVDGLAGVTAVALSPDGRSLYAAGGGEDAVAVFERNLSTGVLSWVEVEREGVDGVVGLAGAADVTVSPDGEHVYVAGADGDAIAVFERDPVTGALAFRGSAVDGVGGHDGLAGVRSLALGPDGDQVYAIGEDEDSLAVLLRQRGSRCTPSGFGNIDDTVDLTAHGTVTYLVTATLAASATGTLENTANVEIPGDVSDPVLGNENDTHSGNLTPVVDLTITKDDGQTEAVPGTPIAYTITIENAGPSDLVGADVEDLLPPALSNADWSCAATTGLAFVEAEINGVGGVAGLDGGFAVAIAPDPDGPLGPLPGGEHLYIASRASNAVALFARNAATGELDYVESYTDGVDGLDGLGGAAGIALSPDSRHVYATGALDQAVVVFERDTTTGQLTHVQTLYESDPTIDGLEGAIGITVSPDGRHVYVTGETDDTLVVFARNAGTGALTFVEREKDGFGSIPLQTLDGPVAVLVTPDGHQVLVAGAAFDTLLVFERDLATGAVSLSSVQRDGVGGVDGLDLAQAVAISPGGKYVYVAGLADDAIAIFERNALTGDLTWVGVARDGVGGIDGLDGVRALEISSDGQFLFAAGYNEDAVSVFRRDGGTGFLIPAGLARDGVDGVDGLDGARAVAASPDGLHVYVIGEHDDAVAAFRRTGRAACAGTGSGDILDTVSIAVGGSIVYSLGADIDPGATGQLINEVCVTMPAGTVNLGDDCGSDDDTLTPQADLVVTKSNGVEEVVAGTSVIYTVTVENLGPSDAPATHVTDLLPAELSGASWVCSPTGAAFCPSDGVGDIDVLVDLPVGDSVVFALGTLLAPDATGTLSNTAAAAPAAGVTDLVPGNNTATDSDLIVAVADLAIDKGINKTVFDLLEPITFTLDVTNIGPSNAYDVSVVDIRPAGVDIVSATGSGWSCVVDPSFVTCTVATLPPGPAPTITIEATAPGAPAALVNAAGVSAAGSSDPVSANDNDTVSFQVLVVPPTVVRVDSVPTTGDSEVTLMETLVLPVTDLVVEFSEAMFDPAGDADPNDVTNPANYRLLAAGPNGNFSTAICGVPAADDVPVPFATAAYSAGTLETTLTPASGMPLDEELYRLSLCAANLRDASGVALDGNADGTGGDDFVIYFRVRRDNLLDRPYFDFASDLDAWEPSSVQPGEIVVSPPDWATFPLSDSVGLFSLTGGNYLAIHQCVDDVGAESYDLRARANFFSDVAAWAGRFTIEYFGGALCTGAPLATDVSGLLTGVDPGTWEDFMYTTASTPPLTVSLGVHFELVRTGPAQLEVYLDDLALFPFLGVFHDGFETGNFSRWSSTVP